MQNYPVRGATAAKRLRSRDRCAAFERPGRPAPACRHCHVIEGRVRARPGRVRHPRRLIWPPLQQDVEGDTAGGVAGAKSRNAGLGGKGAAGSAQAHGLHAAPATDAPTADPRTCSSGVFIIFTPGGLGSLLERGADAASNAPPLDFDNTLL